MASTFTRTSAGLCLAILLLALLPTARPAYAATFAVTTTVDAPHSLPINGTCSSTLTNNPCTLRAAIEAANYLTGGTHTINLQAAGTYTLTVTGSGESHAATGDLNLNNVNVSIVNASSGTVTIDGNQSDRVFDVGTLTTAQLILSNMTIQHGSAVVSVQGRLEPGLRGGR
jgi:hypothetical protein